MGEKEAWSTRLASHQRGVIYGVAETGVPGPVSQWGSAKGGRLGKSENPTSPTIPMRMCPSVFMQPRHWGGEESVCERERSQEQSEGASSEVKNFAGHRSSRLWPPQCPHGRSRRSVRIDGRTVWHGGEKGRRREEAGGTREGGQEGLWLKSVTIAR